MRLKKQVEYAQKCEAKVHKVTSKESKELSTCFEKVLPHLVEALYIMQKDISALTKVKTTLWMIAENRKGMFESADVETMKEHEKREDLEKQGYIMVEACRKRRVSIVDPIITISQEQSEKLKQLRLKCHSVCMEFQKHGDIIVVHQQRIQKQIEQLQAKYEKFYAEGIASYSLYDQLEETWCISLK